MQLFNQRIEYIGGSTPPDPLGGEPPAELPVTHAAWTASRNDDPAAAMKRLLPLIAELERRLIAVEAQLGIEDSQPGDNTPPAAT